jgi:hypothetical protein
MKKLRSTTTALTILIALTAFAAPLSASAAIVAFTGFETGQNATSLSLAGEVVTGAGSPTATTTTVKNGTYAMECRAVTTAACAFEVRDGLTNTTQNSNFIGQYTNSSVGFWFNVHTFPSIANTGETFFSTSDSNTGATESYRVNADQTVSAYSSVNGGMGTTTWTLSADTWYYVRVHLAVGKNWEADIATSTANGTFTVFSGTAAANMIQGERHLSFGKGANVNGNTVDYIYDDIYFDTASANSFNSRDWAMKVGIFKPAANGNMQGWTGGQLSL